MSVVSIVSPSFNQAAFLEQTIRSVLDQGYPQLEYMVVDGGSTDSSVDIIRRYASRLAWWVSEKDSGQAEAINKGMQRAHGDIVAWLNSDDVYLPGAIAAAVDAFAAHPQAVMIYGDTRAVDGENRTLNILRYRQLSLDDLLCYEIIGQPAVFMRRRAFETAGGLDLSYHFLLDHQLWIKVALQGDIVHVPSQWAAARYHAQAKNLAQATGFAREAFRLLDWMKAEPALRPALARLGRRPEAAAQRMNARYLLDDGQSWAALQAWFHAFLLHPATSLRRMNLLGSAVLDLLGLGAIRTALLDYRKRRLSH